LEGRIHALERVGAQIVADKVTLHQVIRRRTDSHGIRRWPALEARRHVRQLAQGELFVSTGGPDLPHHDQPGVDAYSDGKSNALVPFQEWIERLHRGNSSESRPHGALRIVLMRQRIAKVDQQAIAKVLGNVPIKALHHLGTRGLIGPHHLPVVLRVESSGEEDRVHQVAEHYGQLPAFGLRGCGGGHWRGYRGGLVVWLPVRRSGGFGPWRLVGRRCRCRSPGPDQHGAVLVHGKPVHLDNFRLQIGQVGVVEVELPLQGTIRHPATALEDVEHLLQNLIEGHDQPSPGPTFAFQLLLACQAGCFRKVCKSCKMASTSSRLAPDFASISLSSSSLSSVVNAEASTVISSSDSSSVSNRTLATAFSAILFTIASPIVVPESSVLLGHVVDGFVWWCESWCDVFHRV
jgi:hypothetical protein